MNIKRIIQEEIDSFDWADKVIPPEYVVGTKVSINNMGIDYNGEIIKVYTPSDRMSFTNPEFDDIKYFIKLNLQNGQDAGHYHSDGSDFILRESKFDNKFNQKND